MSNTNRKDAEMAPETQEQTNGSPPETGDQEQQGSQQATTPETGAGEQQQPSTPAEPVKLGDDHPLVKTLAKQKLDIAAQKTELAEARAQAANVTKLEEELGKRPTLEAVAVLQTRYDRLEAFLQAAGGPLSKALDSRSFTKALFETEEDISSIVKDWQKANPTATSQALSSSAAAPAGAKTDINGLLRAAVK